MEARTLFVRHLPEELTFDEKHNFLKYFGAQDISLSNCDGKQKHSAFATFNNVEQAAFALKRLHQLKIFGRALCVEYAKPDQRVHIPSELPSFPKQIIQLRSETEVLSSKKQELEVKISNNINSTRSQMHKSYLLNPNLTYTYPSPTADVVTNIVNALVTIPKFYVQVLHLMNKMNLPAPFGEILTKAPDSAHAVANFLRTAHNGNEDVEDMDESEESELESESEVKPNFIAARNSMNQTKKRFRKRHRLQKCVSTDTKRKKIEKPQEVFDVFEHIKRLTADTTVLPEKLDINLCPSTRPNNETVVVGDKGFGKLQPIIASTALNPLENVGSPSKISDEKAKFITLEQLNFGRLSSTEFLTERVFRNYNAGSPNTRLYLKNLGKLTTERELHHIYGRYIDWRDAEQKNMFDIRVMQEGRMKGQAFVTFPTISQAECALKDTNSYVLNGKPIVAHFARAAKPKVDAHSIIL